MRGQSRHERWFMWQPQGRVRHSITQELAAAMHPIRLHRVLVFSVDGGQKGVPGFNSALASGEFPRQVGTWTSRGRSEPPRTETGVIGACNMFLHKVHTF